MKYNIVKVIALASNTLNQRYMDVNLLDTQDDVYEYLRDEVECYKGDRDLFVPSVVDLSTSHDNKEPILRIENDDVVVWYYLKHAEDEHYEKEWKAFVETSKYYRGSRDNYRALGHILEYRHSNNPYIATFDGRNYTSIDIKMRVVAAGMQETPVDYVVWLRVFMSDKTTYRARGICDKLEHLHKALDSCMNGVAKRTGSTSRVFITRERIAISPDMDAICWEEIINLDNIEVVIMSKEV